MSEAKGSLNLAGTIGFAGERERERKFLRHVWLFGNFDNPNKKIVV